MKKEKSNTDVILSINMLKEKPVKKLITQKQGITTMNLQSIKIIAELTTLKWINFLSTIGN